MSKSDQPTVVDAPAATRAVQRPLPAAWNAGTQADRPARIGIPTLPMHALDAQLPTGPARRPLFGVVSYLLLVILPVLSAGLYYGHFATAQYIAEARFAVRSLSNVSEDYGSGPGQPTALGAAALTQDAYIVASFIHSPEMLKRLSEDIDVRSYFDRPDFDAVSRLSQSASAEALLRYWSSQVTTYIDGPSGIITLYVRAFKPEDARDLAKRITQESEKLINELSERARQDVIARAQDEVSKTETSYRKILADINAFQNHAGLLDPTVKAGETGKLLTTLMTEKLDADSKLFVLGKSLGDTAPNVQLLKNRQASLEKQIETLRAELASSSTAGDNLSNSLTRFAELETDRTLASGLYEAARRNLANAQAEAIRKSAYVSVFVQPAMPDESRYPRRLFSPFMIFLGLTIGWATLALAWASVEDHRL